MVHLKRTALLAAAIALGAAAPAGLAGVGGHGRYDDDVCVKLTLRDRLSDSPLARIKVRNQGRNDQFGVLVSLRADTETGAVLDSWIVDLRARRNWILRLRVTPPEGTTALVATTTLDGVTDQHPDDDVARVELRPGSVPAPAPVPLGAALYAANCASCHGTTAGGTAAGPAIAGKDAGDVGEAVREGEDSMPAFPGLSAADIRALAAWLQDPVPVEPPPPPPPPPPGTAPTYTGQVKALLDANCGACHSGKNAAMNLRFDTFATASANAAAGLGAVEAGRMPKSGPLPAAGVQLLQDWVAGGKKQ